MEAFDNDSIREYAARLMDKVQSQARDLEKMVCIADLVKRQWSDLSPHLGIE